MFLTCVISSCRTVDRAVKSLEMVEDAERGFHVENSNLGYALLIYGCPGINIKRDEYSESDNDRCDYFSDDDDEEEGDDEEEDSESENDDDMSLEGVAFDGDDLDDSESDNDHHEVDDDDMDDELKEGQEGEDTSDDDNTE